MSKNIPMLFGGCEAALEAVHALREQTNYSLQTCAIIALVGAVKEVAWEIEELKDIYTEGQAQAEERL
jgi:hypothetical protein